MFRYAWLGLKRIAVLVPGIIVAYLSIRTTLPFFSERLPFALAVFVAYLIAAYVFLPAVWRLVWIMTPAKQLPPYCVTPDGFASDPLNIGLVGSRRQLVDAMEAAGWHVARPITPRSIMATIYAVIFKRSYPGTPLSNLYLMGRKQDISFEVELAEAGRGHRHHVRFWATTLTDIQDFDTDTVVRLGRKERALADNLLWVGAASRDIGITFAKDVWQLTHAVAPNTNYERGLLVRELEMRGLASVVSTIHLRHPYRLPNFAWSRYLWTDGDLTLMHLNKANQ